MSILASGRRGGSQKIQDLSLPPLRKKFGSFADYLVQDGHASGRTVNGGETEGPPEERVVPGAYPDVYELPWKCHLRYFRAFQIHPENPGAQSMLFQDRCFGHQKNRQIVVHRPPAS
ncbi:MAG: hypothetical protein HYU64_12505 [Armatimonadetes bacterium]|nr:hypothetical protein [Armatimonadota bacterium]